MIPPWRVGFTPCSTRHRACSRAHAELVRGYTAERIRQEQARADETGMWCGDEKRWDEDHRLITFKQWLIASRGSNS